jgi:dTDP-4-dehydrorhamnose 3,5-epimerase
MKFVATPIKDLWVIEPRIFDDGRGFFFESYRKSQFDRKGLNTDFVQDNHSLSQLGTLRGLHYQRDPHGQDKLIRVVHGEIYDVAVDIRPASKTFGKWFGIYLSAKNRKLFYIPKGFAHGFVALQDDTQVLYKATNYWAPKAESGIKWDDPELNIEWPIYNMGVNLSDKDKKFPPFRKLAKV